MKFLRIAPWLSIVLFGSVVSGCSEKLTVVLWNDGDLPVSVVIEGKELPIRPGQSGVFDYPSSVQNFTVRLRTSSCDILYLVPAGLPNYPHFPEYYGPVKVQFESDLSIYLAPTDSKDIAPVSSLASWQKDGFPLHPIAKTCH